MSAPSENTWHGLSWPGLELNRIYLQIPGSRRVTRNRELLKQSPYIASRVAVLLECPLSEEFCREEEFVSPEFGGLPDRYDSQRKAAVDSTQAPTVQLSAPPFLCSSIQRRV